MQLKASTRELLGKRSRRLYGQGKLSAVVYGHNATPTPLELDRLEFQKVFVKSGRTHLVDLIVDGAKTEKVLVREIQTHPRRLGPIHVIFSSRFTWSGSPPRSSAETQTCSSRFTCCASNASRPTYPRRLRSTSRRSRRSRLSFASTTS